MHYKNDTLFYFQMNSMWTQFQSEYYYFSYTIYCSTQGARPAYGIIQFGPKVGLLAPVL